MRECVSRDCEGVEDRLRKYKRRKWQRQNIYWKQWQMLKRAEQWIQQTFQAGRLRGEMMERKAQRPNMVLITPFELDYRAKAVAWNNSMCCSIRGLPPTDRCMSQSATALGEIAVLAQM